MMAESLPHSSEEATEERICDPCKEEGETNVGIKICTDCKEVFCKTCLRYHQNFKMSKSHKLADVGQFSVDTHTTDALPDVGKCDDHPERDAEIYCKSHDAVVCSLCSTFRHTGCDMVEISRHGIDVPKLQKDTETLLANMKAAVEHCDHIQTLRMDIQNKFEEKLKALRENIKQVRDQIVEMMDCVVVYVSDVAKQIEQEREDKIEAYMLNVTSIKEIIQENITQLETAVRNEQGRQKSMSTLMMRKRFDKTIKQIGDEDRKVKHFDVELVIGDKLKKLIDSMDIENLVQVKVIECESNHSPFVSVLAQQSDTTAESEILRERELVKVVEHTVSSDTGREPWYCGISVFSDGRVILSDYGWNVFSTGYERLYNPVDGTKLKLKMTGYPFSAAQIDDIHLAVSVPDTKTISIITVGKNLREDKNFKVQNVPYSIVALGNGQLAVAWGSPPAFGVVNVSDTEIVQKSYMDQDTTGRKFESFEYLAVDERRQHVIQPCTTDNTVYCFDLSGKPVFKYKHSGLTNPRGVALDRCGNIYVCEYSKSSIHKLSPTGDSISVITEGVPYRPLAICSDVTGTGFWITSHSSPCDQIVYFRLEQNQQP